MSWLDDMLNVGGYTTVMADGTALTQRRTLNVIGGSSYDDAVNGRTIVVIPAGAMKPGDSCTIYVDKGGNDTTAQRGNIGLPYATITAALAAAQSGDVVRVGPGTWAELVVWPEVANLSLVGSGLDVTRIEMANSGGDYTLLISPKTTPITRVTISDLTVYDPGGGFAIGISGTAQMIAHVVLHGVRAYTDSSSGSEIQHISGAVRIDGCDLDALYLSKVAYGYIRDTRCPDGATVQWLIGDAPASGNVSFVGCDLGSLRVTGLANVTTTGCRIDGTMATLIDDEAGAQGVLTASCCSLGAVTASGTAVVAGDIVVLDACKVASLTVTKTGAAGTRVTASAKGCSIAGAVSAGASCDLDIRGSHFVQASLAAVGDGTIERSTHREAIHLLPTGGGGPVDVTFAVPFTTNAYSVAFSVQRPGIDPRVTITSATGIRCESTLEDEDAAFMVLHD